MPKMRQAYESEAISITRDTVEWPQTWFVYGTANEYEALKFAFYTLAPYCGGLALDKLRVGSRVGIGVWAVEAIYSSKRAEPINKDATEGQDVPGYEAEEVDYQVSGELRNIKRAFDYTSYGRGDIPDDKGIIGRDKNGVKGIDVPFPVVSFTVRKQWQRQDITLEMRNLWERMTGKLNDAGFRGYDVGEVRFDGVSLSLKGGPTQLVAVTFQFSVRFNEEDVELDPPASEEDEGVTVPLIEGWQVLEQKFDEEKDDAANAMVNRFQYANLFTVHKYADFSELGIGGSEE